MFSGIFERKKAKAKLQQITASDWKCSSCDQVHSGLFDLAAFNPDFWTGEKAYAPNSKLTLEGDFLSEDFCVIEGENFFVRCVLEFPIKGFDLTFGFGVWSTLSRENFEKYVGGFDDGAFEDETYWSSWFSNQIKGIDNVIKKECWVNPQKDRQRPRILFMDENHPVTIAQKTGMEPEWLLDIYEANGHRVK